MPQSHRDNARIQGENFSIEGEQIRRYFPQYVDLFHPSVKAARRSVFANMYGDNLDEIERQETRYCNLKKKHNEKFPGARVEFFV
ncbi:MAG: hypothetical protein GYA55_01100, partial [SAR324 cluster bacterium]|nr:hypothetical protein [SAR324 cluster bacterium]